jgi:RNA polymerase sigma factor (sigma-70 family)
MADTPTFADFIQRIRSGDGRAAEELVRRYEPLVRREVRLRLDDRRLERVFDSMDVCQSVLKSFFVRTAAGQFDLDEPGELVRLLVAMARNKLASAARQANRQKRDHRRATGDDAALEAVAGGGPTPSRLAAGRELLGEVRGRFTEEERRLADLRADGMTWEEVAGRVGGTAQARRVQFGRAVDRVAAELNLDGSTDE